MQQDIRLPLSEPRRTTRRKCKRGSRRPRLTTISGPRKKTNRTRKPKQPRPRTNYGEETRHLPAIEKPQPEHLPVLGAYSSFSAKPISAMASRCNRSPPGEDTLLTACRGGGKAAPADPSPPAPPPPPPPPPATPGASPTATAAAAAPLRSAPLPGASPPLNPPGAAVRNLSTGGRAPGQP